MHPLETFEITYYGWDYCYVALNQSIQCYNQTDFHGAKSFNGTNICQILTTFANFLRKIYYPGGSSDVCKVLMLPG